MLKARALSKEEARRAAMVAAGERARGPAPQKYRAIAEWWRLHAEESAVSEQSLEYAVGQDALAADMESQPAYYARKPADVTDWQWMQLRVARAIIAKQEAANVSAA